MNYDIRIEDDAGNAYYPHGHAKTNFMSDGKDVETAIGQIGSDLATHKAETVSKNFLVDMPVTDTTKTTVYLGFRPKAIMLNACIQNRNLASWSTIDETGLNYALAYNGADVRYEFFGQCVVLSDGSNHIYGALSITDTGFEIIWSVVGTPGGTLRRISGIAMTH